jgi:hypothetical protein
MIRDLSAFGRLGLEQKLLGWQLRLRHLVAAACAALGLPDDAGGSAAG